VLGAEDQVNEDRRQGLRHVFGSRLLIISRFQRLSSPDDNNPGPLAQAIAFRAFGAQD
jgi:hypothetical protein